MNRDYQITHEVRTTRVKNDEPVNTGLAEKKQRDRAALHGSKTYDKLSDFYRVVPRPMLEEGLLTVIRWDKPTEGHEIKYFETANMTDVTLDKLFGRIITGEVHFDEAVITLHKEKLGSQFSVATVEGELPDWVTVSGSTWSSPERLCDYLVRETVAHYARKRQRRPVEHETYEKAIKAQAYDQAYAFLETALEYVVKTAHGRVEFDSVAFNECTKLITKANGSPRFQQFIARELARVH